jgi:hypothetical protein
MATLRSPRPSDSVQASQPKTRGGSLSVLHGGERRKRRIVVAAVFVLLALAAGATLLLSHFSFRRTAVIQDLEDATGATVQVRGFRERYFPHPGCVLEGVTLLQKGRPTSPPLVTVERLTVVGSYLRLLNPYVPVMKAEGMHVIVPPLGSGAFSSQKKSKTVIGQFVTDNAVLEFTRRDPNAPRLKFLLHRFVIHALASGKPMDFESWLSNPEPPGEIRVNGTLGPWNEKDASQTPLKGSYAFDRANLAALGGIAGVLSSSGSFQGTLKQIAVDGSTDTPAFQVKGSHHPTHLRTGFQAYVNATNGDVILRNVSAHFSNTTLQTRGTVRREQPQQGKTATIEFVGREGRIEDLMALFIRDKKSPIAGVVSFGATAMVPPKDGPFLKKVVFEADFGIEAARFTTPEKQDEMERLSERARGKAEKAEDDQVPPDRVLSDLTGHVLLKNGVATFSHLAFTVPGATANMRGTYDLITERVDLHGTLRIATKLSKTTTGLKSFLLKVISPFTKKEKPAAPIPVSITGTWSHPEYHVSVP